MTVYVDDMYRTALFGSYPASYLSYQPRRILIRSVARARVRVCARFRPRTDHSTTTYAKRALRRLSHRYRALDTEIDELDTEIRRLCAQANPALLAAEGVGHVAARMSTELVGVGGIAVARYPIHRGAG